MDPIHLIAAALALFTLVALCAAHTARARLSNLRANCYLTDHRGVRVRYSKVSAEVQAQAEAGVIIR